MTKKTINTSLTDPVIIDPRLFNNYSDSGDGVSLVELWILFVKYKKMLFISMLAVIVLAFVYMLFIPEQYIYKTDISIGTQSESQLVQSPEAIVANLDNAIIPKLLKQQHIKQPGNKLKVFASIPKDTDSVLLTTKGTVDQGTAIITLHKQLIAILAESHTSKTQHMVDYLKDDLISSQLMLDELNNKTLGSQGDNEQIILQIISIKENIRKTKRNIAEFTPTYSALGTIQSLKPTNKNIKIIIVASLFIGLFIGTSSVLFAGFLDKVKNQSNI